MTETRDPDPTNPLGVATSMKLFPVESFRWTTHEERAGTLAAKLEAKLATPPDFRFYAHHTTMAEFCWTNGISCIFGGLADEEYVRYPGPPERFHVSEEYGWKVVSAPRG